MHYFYDFGLLSVFCFPNWGHWFFEWDFNFLFSLPLASTLFYERCRGEEGTLLWRDDYVLGNRFNNVLKICLETEHKFGTIKISRFIVCPKIHRLSFTCLCAQTMCFVEWRPWDPEKIWFIWRSINFVRSPITGRDSSVFDLSWYFRFFPKIDRMVFSK